MLFYFLFFRLIYDCSHYVRKNAELVEKPHLNSNVESLGNLILFQLKNECYPLESISHELWQIVVKMGVHQMQILLKITRNQIKIEEYFLKVLLN